MTINSVGSSQEPGEYIVEIIVDCWSISVSGVELDVLVTVIEPPVVVHQLHLGVEGPVLVQLPSLCKNLSQNSLGSTAM